MIMKIKYIIPIIATLIAVALPVSAHRGKTDAYGGHYDNETGEYHYHHGYPAHEHINGVCPYNFDDQTNHQNGTSSSTATHKPENHIESPDPLSPALADIKPTSSPVSVSTETTTGTATPKTNKSNGLFLLVPAAVGGCIGIYALRRRKKDKQTSTDTDATSPQNSKHIKIPKGYSLDERSLPYTNDRVYGWGEEFNVFVTKYGKCYHQSRCNSLTQKNKRLLHRYTAINKGYKPCPHCKPIDCIDEWYKE